MRIRYLPHVAGALALCGLAATVFIARADDDPPDPSKGIEVMARGPVHEAYAAPSEGRPEPGPIVAKQPPDPIQELAPDQKPEGDTIAWIPGYFTWDDEASDFTWVSGFWRNPPPGRDWTPGHWQEVDGGWQWVSGFWAAQDVQTVEYLPPPPPSIDNGASIPAPDETSTYVPGCWVYRETHYLWRPGYWVDYRPDWCWMPDHYCWTPTGYLFVGGYWDYPLHNRGLLFAPVRFDREVLGRQNWNYTPEYVIEPDFLLGALFARPAYGHYYFGDYFEGRYQRDGFTAWVDYRVGRHAYDPNYSYYHHRFQSEEHWESNLRDLYAMRRSGDIPRPPHTWAQQSQVVSKITTSRTENALVAKNANITNLQNVAALTSLRKAESINVTGLAPITGPRVKEGKAPPLTPAIKLEAVTKEHQTEVKQRVKQFRELSDAHQRDQAKMLSEGSVPVKPTDPPKIVKLETPKAAVHPVDPRPSPKNPASVAPPPPPAPKHEERPIPPHEAPTPSAPPKHTNPPLSKDPPATPPKDPPTLPKDPPKPPKDPATSPKDPPTPPKPPKDPATPPKELPVPPTPKDPPKPPPTPKEPPVPKEPATPKEPPLPPAPPKPLPIPPKEAPPPPKEVPLPPAPPKPAPLPPKDPPVPPKEAPPVHVPAPPAPPTPRPAPPAPPTHKDKPPQGVFDS